LAAAESTRAAEEVVLLASTTTERPNFQFSKPSGKVTEPFGSQNGPPTLNWTDSAFNEFSEFFRASASRIARQKRIARDGPTIRPGGDKERRSRAAGQRLN
jgi:hypothetical protein